ncbi:iron complex outermembrane receptor protein [Kordia periserrulae]|uniref:Iron complex outermembrane receptor protein n=1 Tax=Kordia periserrulae TaxID=701523 RepID=A0A2T6C463_9FLAO|nr:TonB-dependent receptor [Kordia periserrulae]PTX63094.1 iron complex outermembrane receptor protein [Kordia periserrulae]
MPIKLPKNRRLLFFFLCFTITIHAQQRIDGTVVDADTNLPVFNAVVTDTFSKTTTKTNYRGKFSLSVATTENVELQISLEGYQSQKINTIAGKNITISLQPKNNTLDAVIINGLTIEQQLKQTTETVSIVSKSEINSENTVQLAPILNRVPGVFMQSGSLNTNRITIRGIGARSPFATANIRAYYADIPLTDGNGESAIEDLELAAISRMEIHKGPSSSSYGVGLGGTILLYPEYAKFNETNTNLFTTVGSFGLFRTVAKVTHGGEKANINVIYSNTHSDGYRENNALDKATATITSNWLVNEQNELTFLGNYTTLKAFIPSSLNREDYENAPQSAAAIWNNARGFEDFKKTLFGVNWRHDFNDNYTQKTSIFSSFNSNYEPRPFNILEEKATTFGIRTRLLATNTFENSTLKWSVGGELFFDDYNAKQYDNLYQDFPAGTGSVAGDIVSNIDETRNYFNLFAEAIYEWKKLSFSVGLHVNQTKYTAENQLNASAKEEFAFDAIVSPKFGVNYEVASNFNLFGSVAHGFSTPTTAETLFPNGAFNPDIKAERGWNVEIGSRFHTKNRKLSGSVSLYAMAVSDLLVNRRTATDQNITLNAGKTTHNGIEAALRYELINTGSFTLSSYVNASLNDFRFKEFTETNANFSGNDLTGVPKSVVNLGIELTSQKGFYGRLDFQAVGEMPANDENTVYSDAFELLNGKIGYQNTIGSQFSYDISLGANNIFDTKYVSQLQVNAFGNDATARYFYPGLPFNMYGGVQLNYQL